MRYQPTIDVWALSEAERKNLQPGQWVRAGEAIGRYLGQRPTGSDVCLWKGPKGSYRARMAALRAYAKS